LTDEDHEDLIDLLKTRKGKVMLSGYSNSIYERLGWKRVEFETACYAAPRTRATGLQGDGVALSRQRRIEVVWLNYDNHVKQKFFSLGKRELDEG
jgi:hypothetical protein